jgi:enamine deaminase RidA (YjgF/YER057c/UK114 family)
LAAILASPALLPQEKKRKGKKGEEEITQTLPALPDPPPAVAGETRRLVFHVAPLSSKGLLSQQTRDGLKALWNANRGAQIIKIRAFVAGTGDLRRVPQIIAEEFSEKHQAVPAVSVIQVGALPVEGAQVQLESVGVAGKVVNPDGIAFFAGKAAPTPEESFAGLKQVADSLGIDARAVLRTTCFLSNLDDGTKALAAARATFPATELSIMQLQRIPGVPLTECECVARLSAPPDAPVKMASPVESARNSAYSQVALVNAERLVFSGLQMGFGAAEADARLAFDRVKKTIEALGASLKRTVMSNWYPLTAAARDRMRSLRFSYFDESHPPASTVLLYEGLPSLDAIFGLEVVAATER